MRDITQELIAIYTLARVLEWADLDSEIITAGLTNDPRRPPQLIIQANTVSMCQLSSYYVFLL